MFKTIQSKSISMPTFSDNLITFIDTKIRICSWNKELLENAKIILSISTNLFLQVHSNIPINKIINVFLFQFPYILGQFSVLFTGFISKWTIMIIVTFFENIFTNTMVIFISSCTNRCFLNKPLRTTVTIHRAICF